MSGATLHPGIAGDPDSILRLAKHLLTAGEGAKAAALLDEALRQHSGHHEMRALARFAHSRGVSTWHFSMLADEARNQAFETALRRAIQPAMTVLDIGTGSGLLSMLAARMGAGRVVACELNEDIARTAREIVAGNGLADRITILSGHSRKIDPERDLGGGADLIVTEIFSNALLQEGALPSIEDAVTRLLRPGGRIIPQIGSIEIALAFDAQPDRKRVDRVCGFDLSAFNRHAPISYKIAASDPALSLRGPPQSAFRFAFQSGGPFPAGQAELELEAHCGPVNGIACWIRLGLDDMTSFENRPGAGRTSHWKCLFFRISELPDPQEGQSVRVVARHDRSDFTLWAEIA